MPLHPSVSATRLAFDPLPRSRLWSSPQRACSSIVQYAAHCRAAYAAALLYEELRKLPDVELHRRGTTRNDLHRHVFRTAAG